MTTDVRPLPASGRNPNAVAGALGIFLTWYPVTALRIPLPEHPVDRTAVTGLWQALMTIVLPYAWAASRLKIGPAELGLSTRNLGRSLALGIALYAIAMAAFVYGRHDPLIADHAVRHVQGGGCGCSAARWDSSPPAPTSRRAASSCWRSRSTGRSGSRS